MQIYLDEDRLADSAETLEGAIELARQRAAGRERVIVDVVVDGRSLAPEHLDDRAVLETAFDEVRLITAEPRAFVRVTLQDAADALEAARADQKAAAEAFEAGRTADGFASIERSLAVWQAARQSLDQGAGLLGLDLTTLPAGTRGELPGAITALSGALEELRRAVQAQDWAGLSDLLLYDLDELAERWQTLLHGVAEHVAAAGS